MSNTIDPKEVSKVIEFLRDSATSILGSALSNETLSAFYAGGAGGFPFNWQDTTDPTQFNQKTYDWIEKNLKGGSAPDYTHAEGDTFINEYISAITAVGYHLSSSDQAQLTKDNQQTVEQATALVNNWYHTWHSYPDQKGSTPLQKILKEIEMNWGPDGKTVSLYQMRQCPDLNSLLVNTPPDGYAILPLLANWLAAADASIGLMNSITMNGGYLTNAADGAKMPNKMNGGMLTNDGSGKYYPAYSVSPQMSTIQNFMQGESNKLEMSATIQRSSESEYKVNISSGVEVEIPVEDWFTAKVGANAHYFRDEIATSSNEVTMSLTYTGVNLVHFEPMPYSESENQGWYFIQPIMDSIKNGEQDVTGFKFSPNPNIDWSENGPFSFLSGVAIANYPTVTITVKGSNYQSIATTFEQSVDTSFSFLGIPLGLDGSENTYSHSVTTDSTTETITITLSPPKAMIGGVVNDSVAWVLGAVVEYPCSNI